eukprot:TRINITY_DN17555_c0_g1_i1.p1 TRINITY_DN17555_c0_g1~~TRINITY_DN17555_c0_g1_i1.p1  ORF type:complete len:267 (+),score=54.16 TRINITY_DN17555_c0_g1_i1:84-803(+)
MLTLYGVPISQPFRAVAWLLLLKKHPFQIELTVPGSSGKKGSRNPAFLEKVPGGTVPALDDGGFVLSESNAMMEYLCDKNQWVDMYPKGIEDRAKLNQILHWYHRTLREASTGIFAKFVRKDLTIKGNAAKFFVGRACDAMEQVYLKDTQFLNSDTVTIADLTAYTELGQLWLCNLFDFGKYPKIVAWMTRMRSLPHHDLLFSPCLTFGDLSNKDVTEDDIRVTNITALKAISGQASKL